MLHFQQIVLVTSFFEEGLIYLEILNYIKMSTQHALEKKNFHASCFQHEHEERKIHNIFIVLTTFNALGSHGNLCLSKYFSLPPSVH